MLHLRMHVHEEGSHGGTGSTTGSISDSAVIIRRLAGGCCAAACSMQKLRLSMNSARKVLPALPITWRCPFTRDNLLGAKGHWRPTIDQKCTALDYHDSYSTCAPRKHLLTFKLFRDTQVGIPSPQRVFSGKSPIRESHSKWRCSRGTWLSVVL